MKYIKSKIIKETLKKLDLEEEREFLRDLTSNGIQYIENNFELQLLEMEKNIENRYLEKEQDYTIYSMPVNIEIYNKYSEIFFPLDKKDTEKKRLVARRHADRPAWPDLPRSIGAGCVSGGGADPVRVL